MGDRNNEGDAESVLSNRRRQQVVDQLQTHGTMTLRDLAEQIAVADQETGILDLPREAIEEVEIALHHIHVPKLKRAGLVRYDARQKLVALTETAPTVEVDELPAFGRPVQEDTVTVELGLDTIEALHESMRADEQLEERMSYDAVISTLIELRAASRDGSAMGSESADEEEAR